MVRPSVRLLYALHCESRQCVVADMRALAEHMSDCARHRQRRFVLRRFANAVRALTASRFTSMALLCVAAWQAALLAG
jgi:hypothetical protein